MSVLIRGMEMPERCWDCDLCYDKFYCKSLEIYLLGEQDKKCRPEDFYPADDRLPNCPLVPVPPHGDLIDHNALKIAVMYYDAETRIDFLKHAMDCINKAPVVIPSDMPIYGAEEGET